ncbi:unnamed protein product [Cutaneotrichosporon oleaginosum]
MAHDPLLPSLTPLPGPSSAPFSLAIPRPPRAPPSLSRLCAAACGHHFGLMAAVLITHDGSSLTLTLSLALLYIPLLLLLGPRLVLLIPPPFPPCSPPPHSPLQVALTPHSPPHSSQSHLQHSPFHSTVHSIPILAPVDNRSQRSLLTTKVHDPRHVRPFTPPPH